VNRVGTDGQGISYVGESMVVDGKGRILNDLIIGSEDVIYAEISLTELRKLRNDFPAHKDADNFSLE
jgi:predicted amidohydrolase